MEGRYPTTKPTTILTVPDLGGGQRGRGPGPPTNTGPSIEQFFLFLVEASRTAIVVTKKDRS